MPEYQIDVAKTALYLSCPMSYFRGRLYFAKRL